MTVIVLLSVVLLRSLPGAQTGCFNQTVRLNNENSTESGNNGIVQYCFNGSWATLCRGGGVWQAREAIVTCRQLGYQGGIQSGSSDGSYIKPFTIFRFAMSCDSTENSIEECGGIRINKSICGDQLGRLQCLPVDCENGEVRLVGGSINREGRVEVCMGRHWRTVCNKSQDGIAGAVCSQLGFPRRGARAISKFLSAGAPIQNCTVTYNGQMYCDLTSDGSCDHTMDLWLWEQSLVSYSLYKQSLSSFFVSLFECSSSPQQSPLGLSTKRDECYTLKQLDDQQGGDTMPIESTYDDLGPEIDCGINKAEQDNPTQVQEEDSKDGNDFYDTEQHTYSTVIKKRAKTSGAFLMTLHQKTTNKEMISMMLSNTFTLQ